MKKQLLMSTLFILFLACTNAYASKTCWCWIGPKGSSGWVNQGDPKKLIDFGGIEVYGNLERHKQQRCSAACAAKAKSVLGDNGALCRLANRPVSSEEASNVAAYSMVGSGDWGNNVWDADGAPSNFQGCTKKCTCPSGWFDANRDSCVNGACGQAPGLPDGDKGGGYFAWHGVLYKNIPGASRCAIEPVAQAAAAAPPTGSPPEVGRTSHVHRDTARFELGGQFTSLNARRNTGTEPGFGGRLTYNALRSVALEAEANVFPRETFASLLGGGRAAQAFVGVKAGPRFQSFGLFGTARAGVQSFGRTVTGYHREREFFFEPDVGRSNLFALNFGGGVELCTGGRLGPRFEAGDTVTFHPSRNGLGARGLVRVPRHAEHNLQVSSGLVYRF